MTGDFGFKESKPKIGIGSFAFRYNIGFDGFVPQKKMTVPDFLEEAHNLGYQGVQLCENLNYASLSRDKLLVVKRRAEELGLFIEIGMKDLTLENVQKHLEIAEILSSTMLRIVVGKNGIFPEKDPDRLADSAAAVLASILPQCKNKGIRIGLENHFDLPTSYLVRIINKINDPYVGLIFDTTNALGFTERPEETLEAIGDRLISIHLKDYNFRKVEAGYLMTGTVLGEGLLKTEAILKKALQLNLLISIILEMTSRRDENSAMEQVLLWEKDVVKKSTEYLFGIMPEVI